MSVCDVYVISKVTSAITWSLITLAAQRSPSLPHHAVGGHGSHGRPLLLSSRPSNWRTITPMSVRALLGFPRANRSLISRTRSHSVAGGGLGGEGGGDGGNGGGGGGGAEGEGGGGVEGGGVDGGGGGECGGESGRGGREGHGNGESTGDAGDGCDGRGRGPMRGPTGGIDGAGAVAEAFEPVSTESSTLAAMEGDAGACGTTLELSAALISSIKMKVITSAPATLTASKSERCRNFRLSVSASSAAAAACASGFCMAISTGFTRDEVPYMVGACACRQGYFQGGLPCRTGERRRLG